MSIVRVIRIGSKRGMISPSTTCVEGLMMGFFAQPPLGYIPEILRTRLTGECPRWTKAKWPQVTEIVCIYTVHKRTSLSTMT